MARVRASSIVAVVVAVLAGGVGWWALSDDSREYPRVDEPFHITKGDGGLEDDLLPHFQVRLNCETTNLRYGEWEDFGPAGWLAGWLALRFEADADCVRQFLFDNDLEPTPGAEIPLDWVARGVRLGSGCRQRELQG